MGAGQHFYAIYLCIILLMNNFAKNLATLIKEDSISQSDLAKKLGVSHQTISRYLSSTREPYIDTLILIAEYFKVTVGQLIGTEEY